MEKEKRYFSYPDPIFFDLRPLADEVCDKANKKLKQDFFVAPKGYKLYTTRIGKTKNSVTSLISYTNIVDETTANRFRKNKLLMEYIAGLTKPALDKLGIPRISMASRLCCFNKEMVSKKTYLIPKYEEVQQKPNSPFKYTGPIMHGMSTFMRPYVDLKPMIFDWLSINKNKEFLKGIPRKELILIDDSVSTTTTLSFVLGLLEQDGFDLTKVHTFAPLKEIQLGRYR